MCVCTRDTLIFEVFLSPAPFPTSRRFTVSCNSLKGVLNDTNSDFFKVVKTVCMAAHTNPTNYQKSIKKKLTKVVRAGGGGFLL